MLAVSAAATNKQKEAELLLLRAQALMDIRASDSLSFHIKARFQILTPANSEGTYTEFWSSPTRWHREIITSERRQIETRVSDKKWVSPDMLHEPSSFGDVEQLLPLLPKALGKVERIRDVHTKIEDVRCVDSSLIQNTFEQTLCFDIKTGTLTLTQTRDRTHMESIEYSSYQNFNGKQYPREFRSFFNKEIRVIGQITELAADSFSQPDLFNPLLNAEEWPLCDKPQAPQVVRSGEVDYPKGEDAIRVESTVRALIGDDGKLRGMWIVNSAGKRFDENALKSVRGWTFRPSKCGDTSIPAVANFEIEFVRH
jgi:hypothetical protein